MERLNPPIGELVRIAVREVDYKPINQVSILNGLVVPAIRFEALTVFG